MPMSPEVRESLRPSPGSGGQGSVRGALPSSRGALRPYSSSMRRLLEQDLPSGRWPLGPCSQCGSPEQERVKSLWGLSSGVQSSGLGAAAGQGRGARSLCGLRALTACSARGSLDRERPKGRCALGAPSSALGAPAQVLRSSLCVLEMPSCSTFSLALLFPQPGGG